MKSPTLLFLLLFISGELFSQINGIILDKQTDAPIAYSNIWIADEEIGTTSDNQGLFIINQDVKNKLLIISSIGYEQKRVQIDGSYLKIYLVLKTYVIKEVTVTPRRKKEMVISQYSKFRLDQYLAPNTPQIFARMFPYLEEYTDNPVIDKIKIETYSKIDATINLRLFKVNDKGEPGDDILKTNYLIKVRKGRRTTKIDNLNNLGIRFPETGIFIAFEYLIIKENEYLFDYYDNKLKMRNKVLASMPMIGTLKTYTPINSWNYRMGKWEKDLGKSDAEMNKKDKNHYLAIELTLTN